MPALDGARRVLVIRHRAGGDLLLATPALRALRSALPATSIDVLTARGLRGILDGNPDVDRVLDFDPRSLASQGALYVRLLRGGYDAVLDLISNPWSATMSALTRAKIRLGYDLAGRRWAYTLALPREPIGPDGRPVLRYAPEAALDFVRALGIAPRGVGLTFRVSADAQNTVDRWISASGVDRGKPMIACLPAGSWPAKTWLPDRFAAVMDALAAEGTAVWMWGPGERAGVEACRARMKAPSLLAPATGWQELGAILKRCALWIGNDSGPKHVAVALGVPTVTIFGPTHPTTWQPPDGAHSAIEVEGLDCLHCNANVCPLAGERHMRCMRDLPAERVVAAVRAILGGVEREAPCASR
ncbi:MAG TPA: glycosyltransferase family 9 protein [Candidatus Eisenbacteria bacterium]|nr:glycosyltransferase family 9 protein [Candidatus Eisenbacteria bacterium]